MQQARALQTDRLAPYGLELNSQVPLNLLSAQLRLPQRCIRLLDQALDRAQISLRGYVRVLRLAWTISDLLCKDYPDEADIDTAMQLRLARVRN